MRPLLIATLLLPTSAVLRAEEPAADKPRAATTVVLTETSILNLKIETAEAEEADFAIVAGGYNSSNTAHLVDLCAEKLPTYFIKSAEKMISEDCILHFDNKSKEEIFTHHFLPQKEKTRVLLTCGASCPDAVVEEILRKTTIRDRGSNNDILALVKYILGC